MKHLFLALLFLCISSPTQASTDKVLDIQAITSKGGIQAWLVEDHSVPVISINFSFDGGLALEHKDKPGVGRLVSILLDEGAGDMNSEAFQKALTNNAIHLGFSAGRDHFSGKVQTLKSKKDIAFGLLTRSLTDPHFEKDAIRRMRNANISQIKSSMGKPNWLIARTFNGTIFENSYYARPGHGHLASMESITRDDLVQFTKMQFSKSVLKVSIAGDITKKEAQKALDQIFGGLPNKELNIPTESVPLHYVGKTILLPLDTPQTFISVGHAGIKRSDKDWQSATVMNYILGGGGFDSHMMREIRKKRGLTYGVYSSINTMKNTEYMQASMSTSNDKAAEAIRVLKEEWQKMATDGATEQEVTDAKAYLTGSLLLQLASTKSIAGILNGLQRHNLPITYINTRNAAINAVTTQDVKRVAKRLLKPNNLTVVLVGKPANITTDITLDTAPGMKTPKEKK